MVRMQVRGKNDLEIPWGERVDVFFAGGSSGTAHYARPEVNKVRRAIYNHGDRGSGAIRIDDGRASAEDDELGGSGLSKQHGR